MRNITKDANNKSIEEYIDDAYDSVYQYDLHQDAYMFVAKKNGRTLR